MKTINTKTTRATKMKKGFTLVELLIVMAIIGILSAIGISQMSGATDTATDTTAKGNVRNAITEATLFYANNTTYTGLTTSADHTVVLNSGSGYCVDVAGATGSFKYDSTTAASIEAGTCN